MVYKILIGKNEINIDEEEKNFFVENQDKKFVVLKSGELVNVAFVHGIIIDHEASRQTKKENLMIENVKYVESIEEPDQNKTKQLLEKYKPDFIN